jgi:hypothetical protein
LVLLDQGSEALESAADTLAHDLLRALQLSGQLIVWAFVEHPCTHSLTLGCVKPLEQL